jgi:hypothetical protein
MIVISRFGNGQHFGRLGQGRECALLRAQSNQRYQLMQAVVYRISFFLEIESAILIPLRTLDSDCN